MGKRYSVGLVGELHYQGAVRRARPGDGVTLALQPDNPHDRNAIVALDRHGDILGYVARENFLQRLVHEEGRGASATVMKVVEEAQGRNLGIVLEVEIDDMDLPTVGYRERETVKGRGAKVDFKLWVGAALLLLLLIGWLF